MNQTWQTAPPMVRGACGGLRKLAKYVKVPAPPPAAKHAPSILTRRIAPVPGGQRSAQVRPERDRETLTGLVKRSRPLCLTREPGIAFSAINNGAKRTQTRRAEVHEVQAVERVESNVGEQKVELLEVHPSTRRLEPPVTLYVRQRRCRGVQDNPRRVVGLNEENMRSRNGRRIHCGTWPIC
jgi:hypothetical protein